VKEKLLVLVTDTGGSIGKLAGGKSLDICIPETVRSEIVII
jgi:hypothetical protein